MNRSIYILLGVSIYIVTMIVIIVVLNIINNKTKKRYENAITNLERDKNLIISASILSELNKVEALVNNEMMQEVYDDWQNRFKQIKDEEVPKITDSLIEIEDVFANKEYKRLDDLIMHAELEVAYVKTKSTILLDEIKEITLSEEKNRETITKLKSEYRNILTKYNNDKDIYEDITSPIELQFENVDKLFAAFEVTMEKNAYMEVGKIVKAIDDTIGNLSLVIEEAPSIIMMGKTLIPRKILDIETIAKKMRKDGFNLDYLNIEYNVAEANKKIQDIFQRLNVLNIQDSIFELKTMMDYYDSLYNDFDKEKLSKTIFDDYKRSIIIKVAKLEKISNELHNKIDDIKYSYDLTDEEVKVIDDMRSELASIRRNYDSVVEIYHKKTQAYSRMGKEMELLNVRLTKVEDKLDITLRTFGSLKEDEVRAREQLDKIKEILVKAKENIKSYKLPVVPKDYYVELSEASQAIDEVVTVLENRPISIKLLNTRVDNARDLVLKVFNTTKETIKTAGMAETAIMYGNRYRPVNSSVDLGLTKAENAFYKGNFKLSLENAINAINIIEPGIYKRLIDEYQK
ncbi:MAG: septation ring formation regulator EzrA [Bacilli bacterium]|nr:septation ring formation regulator EzrA [Bacilli bacterium]